jgi:hypothetical protein
MFWVPEAPEIPGLYALPKPRRLGYIGEKGTELGSRDIHEAVRFTTCEACEQWIAEHADGPPWVAREHGVQP